MIRVVLEPPVRQQVVQRVTAGSPSQLFKTIAQVSPWLHLIQLATKADGIDDPQIKRLIEKMIEAKKEKKDSLDAKMWGYSSFDSSAPYDIFDFRVSRHRDGPDEILGGYELLTDRSGRWAELLHGDPDVGRMACLMHAGQSVVIL